MGNDRDTKDLEFIEEMTKNAGQVQEMVLAEILHQNAQTEYLQRFNLDGATDIASFKSKVPCITYEDIRPEIQRIANGDRSAILTAQPVSEFFISSGTTSGERKPIPMTEEEWDRRQVLTSLLVPVMNSYVPDLNKGKALYFYFAIAEKKTTPGGHMTQPVLTKYYNSEHFRNQRLDPFTQYTSPMEAILCTDHFQSMYAQMLCGLYEQNQVNRLGASVASALLRCIRFLELNWQDLAHDIKSGSVNPKITHPPIRESLAQILKPNRELADLVTKECSRDNWEGIIPRIWPNAKYLDVVITGVMAQYAPMLDYYSGGLPITSTMYACSECCFGINLNPMCTPENVSYTFMPNLAFFEFIPHEPYSPSIDNHTTHKLIDLVDVEVGMDYEVVITTYAGLYRYQVGDILRVTGFHNSSPKFKFLRRKHVLLSIDADKTDEAELQKAINNASQVLQQYKISVADYTSHASTKETPGHYVIYLELVKRDLDNLPSDEVMSHCCIAIENSLSFAYRLLREHNSIAPLEIRVLKNGTFQELMEDALSRGASVGQYKVPRSVKTGPISELLDSRVVSSHFSPWLPSQAREESEE